MTKTTSWETAQLAKLQDVDRMLAYYEASHQTTECTCFIHHDWDTQCPRNYVGKETV